MITGQTGLRERREALVREHMAAENRHEFDVALRSFERPRYELMATGEVFEGAEQVSRYYASSRGAFPDQRNEVRSVRHADDAVIVEFDLLGTHLGPLRGIPPTGKSFRCSMVAIFLFEGEFVTCERVYFDSAAILQQLGILPTLPREG
jgi:steroid delta-isomerase-like uncharacterized protein